MEQRLQAPSAVLDLALIDFLVAYPYPAFILPNPLPPSIQPVYANTAYNRLLDEEPSSTNGHGLQLLPFLTQLADFKEWVSSDSDASFLGTVKPSWSSIVQLELFKTRVGSYTVLTSAYRTPLSSDTASKDPNAPLRPESGLRIPSSMNISSIADEIDWSSSSLGSMSQWPQSLHTAWNLCIVAPYPCLIWWGLNHIVLYNDACIPLLGAQHPAAFGQPASTTWAELWNEIAPVAQSVYGGRPIWKTEDLLLFSKLNPAQTPEESWYDCSWRPIHIEDGSVGGLMSDCFNTTQRVIAERRWAGLRDLITEAIVTTSLSEWGDSVLRALSQEASSHEVPFAALYFCTEHSNGDAQHTDSSPAEGSTSSQNVTLRLVGSVGIPGSHSATPDVLKIRVDLPSEKIETQNESAAVQIMHDTVMDDSPITEDKQDDSSTKTTSKPYNLGPTSLSAKDEEIKEDHLLWPFAQAIKARRVFHVKDLPDHLVEGFDKRGWGDRPREAALLSIGSENQVLPSAILIVGLNPRRPFDEAYKRSTDIVRMTLSTTLVASIGRQADSMRAKQLAELDAAKTSFFNNVSHELRTPLTLIGGPLEDSVNQLPQGNIKTTLRMAMRNVRRLDRLVDSLMDASKIAANKLEGQFRPVRLGILTSNLASAFRTVVERANLQYSIDCDTSATQPVCYVDPDLWEKIVFNLISNAFKYTLFGSITIKLNYKNDHVVFSVCDTGVGIPDEDISKVFKRFHRVRGTSRSTEGTGIGLALTKDFVMLHGGQIDVKSNFKLGQERGSTFSVTLRLGKDHLSPESVVEATIEYDSQRTYTRNMVDEASTWLPSSPFNSPPSSFETDVPENEVNKLDPSTMFFEDGDTVLLVDDNSDMRHYMKLILQQYCTVIEAGNGQQALDIAFTSKPHVIVTDVMMPIMDGYTMINALRERKETSLVPIILVTAKSGEESRVTGLLSGADDYLVKPFHSRELLARVHLQLQLGKRRVYLEKSFIERTLEIQQLSELSPVAIFRADSEGAITYTNPKWFEITGHPHDQDVNDWPESVHPDDRLNVTTWWKEVIDRREQANQRNTSIVEFRWVSGTWCQGQTEPIEDEGILGTFTDISHQKLYEASQLALAQERESVAQKRADDAEIRRKEADERRRGQELLIDVTSHELRQPVSAILNCSLLIRSNMVALRQEFESLMASKPAPNSNNTWLEVVDEDLDSLDSIYQCGLAQERIANDVLSLSRAQLNVLTIHPVEFDLVTEIQRIAMIFRDELRMKAITLVVNIGKSLSELGVSLVYSDKDRFTQIITNLLSNAIRFTDTSTNKREISVDVNVAMEPPSDNSCIPPPISTSKYSIQQAWGTPVFIFVSVTDSGPGLDPRDLENLFQKFQQGSNSHSVFGGSGLGLFVSRQICSLMGGRIEVSELNYEGATFRFFIKASNRTMLVSDAPKSRATTQQISSEIPEIPEIKNPLHVLITEDNLINQTVLNRQLKKAGCTTALANNGLQALDCLRTTSRPFDAVLMDIEMPVLDGLSAVREIRRMEQNGELPRRHRVLALTGNAREGQVRNIRDAGMDDVMIKPYRIEAVLAKIRADS